MTGIYKIESKCKPELCYIGSSVNILNRWRHHLRDLRVNKHRSNLLQQHYNNYSRSDLLFSILLECEKEDLLNIEQAFLDSTNSFFNICKIAGSTFGTERSEESKQKMKRVVSEETRKKLSESHKGIFPSKETRLKLSKIHKGRIPWNKGIKMKPMKDTQKTNIGNARRGKKYPREDK